MQEMASLSELAYEYKGTGFQIIGLVADVASDDSSGMEEAKGILSSLGASHVNITVSNSVINKMLGGVSVVPTTKFYDKNGVLITTVMGAKSKKDWINLIETVMHEKT